MARLLRRPFRICAPTGAAAAPLQLSEFGELLTPVLACGCPSRELRDTDCSIWVNRPPFVRSRLRLQGHVLWSPSGGMAVLGHWGWGKEFSKWFDLRLLSPCYPLD